MCNLYNITTSQEAIRQWTKAMRDILGNLEPSLDVYPNMPGAVVRNAPDGQRELAKLLWGMPTPAERVKGKADYGTTNIRNPQYGHWQQNMSASSTVAWFPLPASPNRRRRQTTRIQKRAFSGTTGSPAARTGRCSFSPVFGRAGKACAR
jgi:hypothetical protein